MTESVWRLRSSGPPLVVGHRGGRGGAFPTENTMPAFEHAFSRGARAVELDARLSVDGRPYVFHDVDLARLTDRRDGRRPDDLEWAELRAVELVGNARIPLLEEVLAWASAMSVAVNVEIKADGRRRDWLSLARAVARVVDEANADVLLSSFDPRLLAVVTAFAPRVPRAWLTDPKESPSFDAMSFCARAPVVHAIHPHLDQLTETRIASAQARGTCFGVYTVNDRDDALRFARWGVDWIITDRPGEMIDWLA